jgi:putative endonuclease
MDASLLKELTVPVFTGTISWVLLRSSLATCGWSGRTPAAGIFDRFAYQMSVGEAWVYMLRCVDGSLYTGWTVDVPRRVARHQAGTASRYTASRLPVELAWVQEMPDRRTAQRTETMIKKLGRREKLALLAAADQRP